MCLAMEIVLKYLIILATLAFRYVLAAKSSDILLENGVDKLSRCNFPKGFIFGTSSSAYQYEGAFQEGGRKPSIWDTFSRIPGMIKDNSNGDVAVDQYHKFKEDTKLMTDMGMDAYRFSISWSRFYPGEVPSQVRIKILISFLCADGQVNPEGRAYYNALIDYLIKSGVEPYITLYHWDHPEALENEGGWLNISIVDKYTKYAEACFEAFGDRVKNWLTFNEPYNFSIDGYSDGKFAPGRCSTCKHGNSLTEPYIVAHHILLSHANTVKVYRENYQGKQGGRIGIVLNSHWYEPYTELQQDKDAAGRSMDFRVGWLLGPITYGEYPASMKLHVNTRLPIFTKEQRKLLKGSIDFLGLNHYTSYYVQDFPALQNKATEARQDPAVQNLFYRDGVLIGQQSSSPWLYIVPWGIEKLLKYIKKQYNPPAIIITENGVDEANDASLTLEQSLQDETRVKYHDAYLRHVLAAIRDGVNVSGYFAWSLLDNFEWQSGYTVRFGLHFVDYNDGLKRYPKESALWFKHMLKNTSCHVHM